MYNFFVATLLSFVNKFCINIIIIALPVIALALHTSIHLAHIGIAVSFFGAGVGLFFITPLSDYGARKLIIIALLAIYTIGALMNAIFSNIIVFYIGLFLLGLGSYPSSITIKALLGDTHKKLKKLTIILAVITLISQLAPAIAMIVGGYAVTWSSWHIIFYINTVIGAGLFLLSVCLKSNYHNSNKTLLTEYRETLRHYWQLATRANNVFIALAPAILTAGLYIFFTAGFGFLHYTQHDSLTSLGYGVLFYSVGGMLGGILTAALAKFVTVQHINALAGIISILGAAAFLIFNSIWPGYWSSFLSILVYAIGTSSISVNVKSLLIHRNESDAGTAVGFSATALCLLTAALISAGTWLSYRTPLYIGITLLAISTITLMLVLLDYLSKEHHANN